MVEFNDWMTEEKPVNRWRVMRVFLSGVLAGACLMFVFALAGVI